MSTAPSATSGTHTWLVLMKAHRSLMRHAEHSFKQEDMGLSDFVVLEMLLHKGPQKVNDIGRKIALTSGAITTAVDRVEQRGLVARTFDPQDRRARVVTLTKKGRAVIRRVFDSHVRVMERATGGLTAGERATLVALLKKLGLSAEARLHDDEARRVVMRGSGIGTHQAALEHSQPSSAVATSSQGTHAASVAGPRRTHSIDTRTSQ